jgi:DNA-binding MarR family transcriptional regulator
MANEMLVEELLTFWRLLHRASHPVTREEMTPEQYWLLRTVNRRGPLSIGDLAAALGITASSATTACKRLEKAGLLRRERQTDDERVVHVAPTPEGVARVESWRQRKRDLITQLLSALDRSEQDEMQRLIQRMLDAAGAGEAPGKRQSEQQREPVASRGAEEKR